MQNRSINPTGKAEPNAQDKQERAERYRERFRQMQAIAEKKARIDRAGGTPSEVEAARMIAEFHARGGQVTVCPPADDVSPDADDHHGRPYREKG